MFVIIIILFFIAFEFDRCLTVAAVVDTLNPQNCRRCSYLFEPSSYKLDFGNLWKFFKPLISIVVRARFF